MLTQLETNLDILIPAVEIFRRNSNDEKKLAILNPAPVRPIDKKILSMFDILTPNEVEASILSGIDVTDFISAEKAADFFIRLNVNTVIITMGEQGCFIKSSGSKGGEKPFTASIPAFKVDTIDTTGAGDAFSGGLAAALAAGSTITDAALFGSATAALSVTKIGTAPAMPVLSEIEFFLKKQKL